MRIDSIPSASIRIPNEQGAALPVPGESGDKSFGQFLADAVSEVNAQQRHAGEVVQRFALGEPMDVHEVMIALEQASTAMALTLQIRNQLVAGYQEIMRTQV